MEKEAFCTLARQLRGGILSLSRRFLREESEAEDNVQDTLLRLWTIREQLDKVRSVQALSYAICKNLCISKLRKRRIVPMELSDEIRLISTHDSQWMLEEKENAEWLKPYAEWLSQNNQNTPTIQNTQSFYFFLQFLLHQQLKAAADYARSKGVILKGDLPIGVNRESVETKEHPELFHLDSQTGAPPDVFTSKGQNWGFPTYQWSDGLISWFHKRLHHMEQYFDAIRIDHILGFFRVWEIPEDAIDGLLGHFSPSLPLTVGEIEYFGLAFRKELFTRPFINDRLIDRIFGIHAQYVRDTFLVRKAYNLYDLREDYATQRKVATAFADRRDESSLWIRDGLMRLISNVLFVEDPRQPEMYHPRIGILNEPIYEALGSEDKDAFVRLYNNYFYQRHSMYWGQQALKRLPAILKDSRMLICGEDLGMLPDCVEPVLDKLRILTSLSLCFYYFYS